MTEIFNADSARALMKDVENNPYYIDIILRIKHEAQNAGREIAVDLVKPEIENKLKSLGFEVSEYTSIYTDGKYTKIKW